MLSYSRSHLANHVLIGTLAAVVKQDRITTAEMLALIAEVDRRGLHRVHGYDSLAPYLVDKLGMSEDMVYKRIGSGGAGVPGDHGRLHLSAILIVRPHLTAENASELLTEASRKDAGSGRAHGGCAFPEVRCSRVSDTARRSIPGPSS